MSTTIPQLPTTAVRNVRPGDQDAATEVEGWLQAYATSRDPVLRERIILPIWTWRTASPAATGTAAGPLLRISSRPPGPG